MSKELHFPEKYYIVWLDAHIGQPDFCIPLKRAFFTHTDPQSGQETPLSDQEIDRLILRHLEFPATFNNFHFTLRAFTEERECLDYIDTIQHHRIIFISSSTLGESAVGELIERYPHSFTNARTGNPYDSIYIFCVDMVRAAQWAGAYVEYVQIFDFETDLLMRLIKDLGEEFITHGKELLDANENHPAIERLSWSKSLFIRFDKLKSQCQARQSKPSAQLQEIDRLLDIAEERVRKQQQEDDSDDDNFQIQTMSTEIPVTEPDHLVIWLDPRFDSAEQVASESEYRNNSADDGSIQTLIELQSEVKECFTNLPGELCIFSDVNECQQFIDGCAQTKTIFLVLSGSTAVTILPSSQETWRSIKKIYTFDISVTDIGNRMDQYQNRRKDILLFDTHKNLLIRLLEDISQYYLAKGEQLQNRIVSPRNLIAPYFDWPKEMIRRAKEMIDTDFHNQLKNIEAHHNAFDKLNIASEPAVNVEEQLSKCLLEEDGDSVIIIFIVGMEAKLLHLDSGVAQLITCTSNNEVVSAINNVHVSTRIIVVSSTTPREEVLSLTQLLNYYCLIRAEESGRISATKLANVTYVNSIDHLVSQLYHKLGEYYRDAALQASVQSKDREKTMRLLDKSTQCYQLLEDDTNKILKHYAELLKEEKSPIRLVTKRNN